MKIYLYCKFKNSYIMRINAYKRNKRIYNVPTNFLICVATFDISSLSRQQRPRKAIEYPTIFSASDTARFQLVTFADDPHTLTLLIPFCARLKFENSFVLSSSRCTEYGTPQRKPQDWKRRQSEELTVLCNWTRYQ